MLKEPEDPLYRRSYEEELKIFRESMTSIGKNYPVSRVTSKEEIRIHKILSSFYSLKQYPKVIIRDSLRIGDFYIVILSMNSLVRQYRYHYENVTEMELIGLCKTTASLGKTFIRPENLEDKIRELFAPVEVDFEFDKLFSKKYFVLTDNEENLRKNLTPAFLAGIRDHNGFEIETNERNMLIRKCQRITAQNALEITAVTQHISKF